MNAKRILVILLFAAVVAFLFWPQSPSFTSSELKTVKTEDGNTVTTSYVDAEGNITFATDKQFATIIRTYDDGHVVREMYLDEKGRPAKQSQGHYGLARDFEDGLAVVIIYLDAKGNPMTSRDGFSEIRRTYNDRRLYETDTYFDLEGNQVPHKNGFYIYHRDYDDRGNVSEISYHGLNGELVEHANGYARIEKIYNDAGKVEFEFYYHADGSPATASLGQYGLYHEYDSEGHQTLTTYLGPDKKPMTISEGYSTIRRTYENGKLKTVRYFDEAGNPTTARKGQYGVEYVEGRSIYLDENGNRIFRIDNFLEYHPEVTVVLTAVLVLIALAVKGRAKVAYLFLYLIIIAVMTLWYRESGESKSAEALWSFKQFFSEPYMRLEILNNILLFVPLGVILFRSFPSPWTFLTVVMISALIEGIQYFTGLGLAEVDDVISNSIGGALGMLIAEAFGKRGAET